MGCIFSRNEALTFRKKKKVSKVQKVVNFSQKSLKNDAFASMLRDCLFKRFLQTVKLCDVNAHAIQIQNLREIWDETCAAGETGY